MGVLLPVSFCWKKPIRKKGGGTAYKTKSRRNTQNPEINRRDQGKTFLDTKLSTVQNTPKLSQAIRGGAVKRA